jgi:CheY-like chemotaxis protein
MLDSRAATLGLSRIHFGARGNHVEMQGALAVGGKKILLVDDDDLVLSATTTLLESKGYAVVTATNAKAALNTLSQPFDAAILDYELPDLNGVQLARCLKAVQPQLPIVLFSGHSDIPDSTLREVAAFVPKANAFPQLLTTLAALTADAT